MYVETKALPKLVCPGLQLLYSLKSTHTAQYYAYYTASLLDLRSMWVERVEKLQALLLLFF